MFEAYNEALVQLSDEGLKEMYLNFMLIYMGEYTEEVLERCQVDEVRVCMPPNGPHATATPRARAPPSRPARPHLSACNWRGSGRNEVAVRVEPSSVAA